MRRTAPPADPAPSPGAGDPLRAVARREALVFSALVLVVLGAVKHGADALAGVSVFGIELAGLLQTLAFAFALYVPVLRIGVHGVDLRSLGVRRDGWRREGAVVLGVAALTVVVYGGGFVAWQVGFEGRSFAPRVPAGFAERALVELFVVALSEELYFRGFLQERFARAEAGRGRWLGVPHARAVVLAAAVFALGHFVGDYRPGRLLTFFPGLVFGWLRARGGLLWGAVAYHAFCNLLQDLCFASVR